MPNLETLKSSLETIIKRIDEMNGNESVPVDTINGAVERVNVLLDTEVEKAKANKQEKLKKKLGGEVKRIMRRYHQGMREYDEYFAGPYRDLRKSEYGESIANQAIEDMVNLVLGRCTTS